MKHPVTPLLAAAAGSAAAFFWGPADGDGLVVFELFTVQGCSSCPPAGLEELCRAG